MCGCKVKKKTYGHDMLRQSNRKGGIRGEVCDRKVGGDMPLLQGGPLPVINGVITRISKVISPVTHLYGRLIRAPCPSIYNHLVG